MTEAERLTKEEMESRIIDFLKTPYAMHPCKITVLVLAVYREEFPFDEYQSLRIKVFDLMTELEERQVVKNIRHSSSTDKTFIVDASQWVLVGKPLI